MDTRQIESSLGALFAQADPLQPRQLVFWYDPDAEFADVFDQLDLGDVQKIKLGGTPFRVKYTLLVECPHTSFLLYAPFAEPRAQENWLLDLQMQAEPFSADRAALLRREYGLQRGLQGYIRDHLNFFNSRRRIQALSALGLDAQSTEHDVCLAMMCVVAGLKVADAAQLIRTVLMNSLTEDLSGQEGQWNELGKYFKPEEFWEVVRRHLGLQADALGDAPTLRDLLIRLALTHLQHDLNAPLPDALQAKVLRSATKAYVFVNAWLRHSDHAKAWARLSDQLAPDLGVASFAQTLPPSAYSRVETFQVFDRVLIRQLTAALSERFSTQSEFSEEAKAEADPERVKTWIGERRALYWFETYRAHYEALEAAAGFQALARHRSPYGKTPEALFESYAERDYRVDQRYRHFISASDRASGDVLTPLIGALERAYVHGFLTPLGEAWSDALAAVGNEVGDDMDSGLDQSCCLPWRLGGFQHQWWFYEHHVKPILDKNDREKVFVIVSDALRYEVAAELEGVLLRDLRGEVALTPLLATLPSVTKLGMAALLPGAHDGLSVTNKGDVLVNGRSSMGTANRNAILNAAGTSSVALHADDLLDGSRDEGRQAVQPHRVIYIYQNRVDAAGDKPASEGQVFDACQRAVAEISQIVRKVANALNGTNILITSDHGFLYQRQPLGQHDKVSLPEGTILDGGRRHALGQELSRPAGTQTFALPQFSEQALQAQSPRGGLRYALQGAGAQYVHGGASLQEVCVPLLTYKHVRASKGVEGPSHKVGVRMNAASRRVTNNHFTLRLVQSEAVGGRVRPRRVIVKFVDQEGETVTNAHPLNLDSAAPSATDREYIVRLSVGITDPDRNSPYYLVVIDAEDDMEVLREAWQISVAFTDDFGEF